MYERMIYLKKCALILPYFGNFHNYFQLFLNSFGNNEYFDLYIFTNNKYKYQYPKNVILVNMELSEIKSRIENKINLSISLNTPYKLCDYKPTYGLIFEDYIKEYEYWGHCDCDLIFGNLEKILLPLLNQNLYDKLFAAGHLTIYRNTEENNKMFMSKYNGVELYKQAFSSEKIYVFDEDYKDKNVHRIFINQNKKVYNQDLSMNPTPKKSRFLRSYYDPVIKKFNWENSTPSKFYWNGKSIIRCTYNKETKKVEENEYLYMHLQSRQMTMKKDVLTASVFEITPTRFLKRNNVPRYKKNLKLYTYYFPNLYWYRIYQMKIIKKIKKIINK